MFIICDLVTEGLEAGDPSSLHFASGHKSEVGANLPRKWRFLQKKWDKIFHANQYRYYSEIGLGRKNNV